LSGDAVSKVCPCPGDSAIPTIGVFTDIDIEECWVIDQHWRGQSRTPMGDLVHAAKTYSQGKLGDRAAAERLGACLGWWTEHLAAQSNSRIASAVAVCPIPANPPKQPFNLPDVLADHVAAALTLSVDHRILRKTQPTLKMKYTADRGEKRRALGRAFHAEPIPQDSTVVLVDDVVWSGATLEAAATALRASGARRIIALIATRATKGLV
jgi:predicted amidophosphoribosyltransferase